jgi:uncharacterized protein
MTRRDLLKSAGLALLAPAALPLRPPLAAEPPAEPPAKRPRILYFTRNVGFYHSVCVRKGDALSHSERIFTELGKQHGFDLVCSKDGRLFDADLDQFDAFALYCNNDLTQPNPQAPKEPPMTKEGKQRLLDAVAAGKGFLGFHSTCACWRTPPKTEKLDPFLQMLGGEFIAHGPQQKATIRVTDPKFPGVEKLGEKFELLEEWYAMKNFAKDLHVILVQETAGMKGDCYQRPPFPSTWARMQGKGRVWFTSLAHREDVWSGQLFQTLLLGGLAWALGTAPADIPPNIETVTPKAGQLKN